MGRLVPRLRHLPATPGRKAGGAMSGLGPAAESAAALDACSRPCPIPWLRAWLGCCSARHCCAARPESANSRPRSRRRGSGPSGRVADRTRSAIPAHRERLYARLVSRAWAATPNVCSATSCNMARRLGSSRRTSQLRLAGRTDRECDFRWSERRPGCIGSWPSNAICTWRRAG